MQLLGREARLVDHEEIHVPVFAKGAVHKEKKYLGVFCKAFSLDVCGHSARAVQEAKLAAHPNLAEIADTHPRRRNTLALWLPVAVAAPP